MLFSKVKKEKILNAILFKYFINIIVSPIVGGVILFICIIPILPFREGGWERSYQELLEPISLWGIYFKNVVWAYITTASFILFLPNVLSVIPFIKLIIDKFQGIEEEKVIEIINETPCYEVNGLSKHKGFVVDTFAKREAAELLIKDKDNVKYRVFWDERFGDDTKAFYTQKTRIKYFKHSKIIFFYEDIPDEPKEQPEKQQKKNINTKKGKKKK